MPCGVSTGSTWNRRCAIQSFGRKNMHRRIAAISWLVVTPGMQIPSPTRPSVGLSMYPCRSRFHLGPQVWGRSLRQYGSGVARLSHTKGKRLLCVRIAVAGLRGGGLYPPWQKSPNPFVRNGWFVFLYGWRRLRLSTLKK